MAETGLSGRRVVITRPEHDAAKLAARLRSLGAIPIVVPAIRIEFTDPPELAAALAGVARYHWVVFTSRNGVEAAFRCVTGIAGPKIAAIGPATAQALRSRGLEPELVPREYVAEAVLEALGNVAGLEILLPRADIARRALADGLRARGATVHEIAAYRTVTAPGRRPDLSGVDAVTFTSSSTVRGFLEGGPAPGGAKIICIGPITARTAREHGLEVTEVAGEYTEDGLVAALIATFSEAPQGRS